MRHTTYRTRHITYHVSHQQDIFQLFDEAADWNKLRQRSLRVGPGPAASGGPAEAAVAAPPPPPDGPRRTPAPGARGRAARPPAAGCLGARIRARPEMARIGPGPREAARADPLNMPRLKSGAHRIRHHTYMTSDFRHRTMPCHAMPCQTRPNKTRLHQTRHMVLQTLNRKASQTLEDLKMEGLCLCWHHDSPSESKAKVAASPRVLLLLRGPRR